MLNSKANRSRKDNAIPSPNFEEEEAIESEGEDMEEDLYDDPDDLPTNLSLVHIPVTHSLVLSYMKVGNSNFTLVKPRTTPSDILEFEVTTPYSAEEITHLKEVLKSADDTYVNNMFPTRTKNYSFVLPYTLKPDVVICQSKSRNFSVLKFSYEPPKAVQIIML